ncbi:hypothetical protein HER32_14895 [Hymenobacter sp. BT18]|uniref:hypothetical protein n=1 Tax=Hymenobacter sp. BT18 TaxID=2835648 RepID=UPI00143E9D02|nr:hypothetical protein [Hymenobacter sp. BT18]QIX62398.1 hypothetical protein HER32_14895 [Hymenobacter sp. BT18]
MTLSGPPTATLPQPPAGGYYWWLLVLVVAVFVGSLYQRVLHGDEAWIGEQAYWAAKEGRVRSELFRGLLHAEQRQWVYHWLFVWQGAGVIRLVGWSALVLKLISLTYLGAFLLVSYRHLRAHFLPTAPACYLFYALLLGNTLVVEYGYVFRPEVMLMFLGFGSWIFLQRYLHTAQPRSLYVLLAALLAGLAALTHFNGLIFVVAGAGLLLLRRRFGAMLVFSGVALGVFSACFWDVIAHEAWAVYIRQLTPAMKHAQPRLLTYLGYVLDEQKRFFHSPAEVTLSLLVLTSAVVLYKSRYRTPRLADAVLYLLFMIGALACLAQGKTTKYLLLYLPHLCLVITLAFVHQPPRPAWLPKALQVLLALYLVANIGFTGYLFSQHEDQPTQNRQLAQQLTRYRHSRVVAPLEFIFHEMEAFSIQGTTCYKVLMETGQIPDGGLSLFEEAARFQRQVIILDENSRHVLGVPVPVPGQRYGQYRYAYRFQKFYVYELQ